MPGDLGSIKYSLREPFDRSVESVCNSLAGRGLRVTGQLDVSRRVERALGIALPACIIVFVLPDPAALSTHSIHPRAAVFLPLHIVISGHDTQTEIHVQNKIHASQNAMAPAIFWPVLELQTQIAEAIEAIAMRPSIVV